jgi:hypothetical protein
MPGMAKSRGNSVLPARREAITLHTYADRTTETFKDVPR